MNNNRLGKKVRILKHSIVYNSEIGDNTLIGNLCVVASCKVGKNCIIENCCVLCKGLTIEDNVFVGDGVIFTNDKRPSITKYQQNKTTEANHQAMPTIIKKGATIGNGSTIVCGVIVGENALLGAGSVLTRSIPPNETWAGNPARKLETEAEAAL
jgi:acetyltransferase-like isoleucine patch superfamily enzyme